MNKFKKVIILLSLLFIYVLISTINYVQATASNISNEVFRLHVIANSDSNEDQNLKYIVRDEVLNYVKTISVNAGSKEEVISLVKENSDNIKEIAKNTIINEGFNYDVNISIGNFSFPTKEYGDISLPSGFYDALRIEIGNASRTKLVVCDVPASLLCWYN